MAGGMSRIYEHSVAGRGGTLMNHYRKKRNRKMKSVEIELSEWVKFNEKNSQEAANIKQQQKPAEELEFLQPQKEETLTEPPQKHSNEEAAPKVIQKRKTSQKQAAQKQPKPKPKPQRSQAQQNYDRAAKQRDSVWETKKEYALVRKEKILEVADQLEQLKKEYKVLAEYHNEINLLEDLPDNGTAKLRETAGMIQKLQEDRKAFHEDLTRLDEGIYLRMNKYTEDMPNVIRKLTEDELYVSKLKAEIDRLEGEKSEQQFEGRAVEKSQGNMKTLSIVCIFTLFFLFSLLIVLQLQFGANMQVATLVCGILFAAVTLGVFIQYFNNVNLAKRTEYQLNKIIKEQNNHKLKYVNAKNGVDYVYQKYNVHSASELLFQWEQFMAMKNARENLQHAENEITYYTDRLQKQLEQYPIQEPEMWLGQIDCLADEEQMNVLKTELKGKIQQSRKKIEGCRKLIQKTRDEISLLAIRNPEYAERIKEITMIPEENKGAV